MFFGDELELFAIDTSVCLADAPEWSWSLSNVEKRDGEWNLHNTALQNINVQAGLSRNCSMKWRERKWTMILWIRALSCLRRKINEVPLVVFLCFFTHVIQDSRFLPETGLWSQVKYMVWYLTHKTNTFLFLSQQYFHTCFTHVIQDPYACLTFFLTVFFLSSALCLGGLTG